MSLTFKQGKGLPSKGEHLEEDHATHYCSCAPGGGPCAETARKMTKDVLYRTPWFLALLLAVGAALFAVGVAVERHSGDLHHIEVSATSTTAHNEASESGGDSGTGAGSESSSGGEGATIEAGGHSESSEKILGVNAESTGVVSVAVALSLTLALLVLVRPRRSVLRAVVVFGLLFAVFDVVEAVHQFDTDHVGIATFAAALTLVHLATALLAAQFRDPVVHRATFAQ